MFDRMENVRQEKLKVYAELYFGIGLGVLNMEGEWLIILPFVVIGVFKEEEGNVEIIDFTK